MCAGCVYGCLSSVCVGGGSVWQVLAGYGHTGCLGVVDRLAKVDAPVGMGSCRYIGNVMVCVVSCAR